LDTLTAAVAEADSDPAYDRVATTAAAHVLATESESITGEDADPSKWFPYSFMTRVVVPDD
jgi:hypothetical protein